MLKFKLGSLRAIKLMLAVIIGGFVLAAAYISVLVIEHQDALRQVSRHNAAWEAAQAVSEFTRLQQRLTEFRSPHSSVDKEEIELRYDILVNREDILRKGHFQALIRHSPDHKETLRQLREALVTIHPIIASLERPGAILQAVEILEPLESKLAALASAAHNYGTEQSAADQQELIRLHWLFSGIGAGLILFGLLLIGLLDRHIRLLGRAHKEVYLLAHHDTLTGLANRVLLREQLEQALAHVRHQGRTIAFLYLDLDRFKDVNDTFGHEMGDALLKIVADRLRGCVRDGDVVARLGGDEFAVLLLAEAKPSECAALAVRIVDSIGAPYDIDGQEIGIGTSIGITVVQDGSLSPSQLLKQADMALYRAKADGRGRFRFFEPAMDAQLQARRALEVDLRRALANGELELFYQPQINVQANEISGFEVLLRWHHPERGTVSPVKFIPVAEDTGLIGSLGEWTIEQACAEAAKWPRGLKVAVNLSPAQFRNRSLVQTVSRALTQSGLEPNRLELEITESILLQDNEVTLSILHRLRRLGVRVAMDDFGTGYSSLSYLRHFPFDKIKIDRSFVQELASRPECLAIVESITTLGRSLGISTTAEGVETEDQYRQIRAAGCTEVQGFYFGRPKPARELAFSLYEHSDAIAV